ncbi:MAG: hypothetical protein IJ733_01700 [Lachnospiraceae bacterium]|nr:hypothetical protein [Lachnospiraceae bacterium]
MKRQIGKKVMICALVMVVVLAGVFGNAGETLAASKIYAGAYSWDDGGAYCVISVKPQGKKVKVQVVFSDYIYPAATKTVKNGQITYSGKCLGESITLKMQFKGKKIKCSGKWDSDKLNFTAKRTDTKPVFQKPGSLFD